MFPHQLRPKWRRKHKENTAELYCPWGVYWEREDDHESKMIKFQWQKLHKWWNGQINYQHLKLDTFRLKVLLWDSLINVLDLAKLCCPTFGTFDFGTCLLIGLVCTYALWDVILVFWIICAKNNHRVLFMIV